MLHVRCMRGFSCPQPQDTDDSVASALECHEISIKSIFRPAGQMCRYSGRDNMKNGPAALSVWNNV